MKLSTKITLKNNKIVPLEQTEILIVINFVEIKLTYNFFFCIFYNCIKTYKL